MSPTAIRAGDAAHRLPEGSSAVAPPVLRPVPGGGGRLFVGMLGGGALPAWVLPGAGYPARAWALVPGPEGAVLVGGDALTSAGGDAEPLQLPDPPPVRTPLARPSAPEGGAVPPAPSGGGFRLAMAGGALDLPFAAMERLLPMPSFHPLPEAPPGARGMAWTEAGAVLVLSGEEGEPLLALLVVEGRRLGLACRGAAPIASAPALPTALLTPALLAAAPLAQSPPAAPAPPTRLLLLARAGGTGFALPLEEVAAVLPPQAPGNPGSGALAGIAAHRGDVLPVLDAGARLGGAPVLAGGAVPMLRLQGAQPAALAVSAVLGLRAVPQADLAPVPGGGLVAAMARLDGGVLPVCRARVLLAPLGSLAGAAP
ncbi:chemotaxis protein CheW [Pararoseomonas sp. SCSIO 73927]|uniref:chemotaxis protein CheW n=1 Tax=Pararoseomonas sp. SCSIO 73927 TaxID=3114537 RepID=UPI0030CCF938